MFLSFLPGSKDVVLYHTTNNSYEHLVVLGKFPDTNHHRPPTIDIRLKILKIRLNSDNFERNSD